MYFSMKIPSKMITIYYYYVLDIGLRSILRTDLSLPKRITYTKTRFAHKKTGVRKTYSFEIIVTIS